MSNDKERVKESILKLKEWLKEPNISESRSKALMRQLGKYQEFLKQLETEKCTTKD